MKDIKLRKVINKINDINSNPEEDDLIIKENDDLEDLFIEGKANPFKINLTKAFMYLDEHYILTTFIKLFFGIIIIFIPIIVFFLISLLDLSSKNDFIFFPCFLSLTLILGLLFILLVVKIGEACQISGFLIYTWERKNIFRIINSLFTGAILLWLLFYFENFYMWFDLLKEKVAQTNSSDSAQSFNKGTYTQRILFILNFWDLGKDSNQEYIHKKLDYFEYEDSVFTEFHDYLNKIFIPIIFFGCFNLFKLIFFRYRKMFLSLIFHILIVFISFFIMYYSNDTDNKDKSDEREYFTHVDCKYIELISYLLIILVLILKSFMSYLKLIKKKYISQKKDNNKLMTIIAIIFFLINFSGYALLISDLVFISFDQIDQNLGIERYYKYWNLFYMGLALILFGYTFSFGHYFFNLIFYPVSYEISPHDKRNSFYIKSSGTIIETKENMFPKRPSQSHKHINLIFDKI